MGLTRKLSFMLSIGLGLNLALLVPAASVAMQAASPGAATRPVGIIKSIAGNSITLGTDSGSEVIVVVEDATRIVQTAPGEKDLKAATPIHVQDLQVGDRLLARGKMSDDGKSVVASMVIAMKRTDISQKQQQELQDWQKRGIGGLVRSIDPAGAIVVSSGAADAKNVTLRISKDTVLRRYSTDSVKFDDAKPATLDQIKPGDQLRARGTKNADGSEIAADEVVSGTFHNIAGTVSAIDSGKSSIRVMDLVTKKTVTVRITGDSQLRKLPPMMAQRIAARLKGSATGAPSGQAGAAGNPTGGAGHGGNAPGGEAGPARGGNGAPDLQQFLSRMPASALSDLQKGDAVMVVTTEGSASSDMTAITLLSGVEPILTASPNGGNAATLLTPWSLGSGGGDAGNQ